MIDKDTTSRTVIKGVELDLAYRKNVGRSEFELLAMKTNVFLLERGWAGTQTYNWDTHAFGLISKGGVAMAVILFCEMQYQKEIHINLAAVEESHRHQGLYTWLFEAFTEFVREKYPWATQIGGGYHVENAPSRAMAEKLGRRVTYHSTRFDL